MKKQWLVPMCLLTILVGTIGVGWAAMRLIHGAPQTDQAARAAKMQDALRAYDPDVSDEDIQKAREVIRTWKGLGRTRVEVEKKFFGFCDHDTSNGEIRDLVNCRQAFRLLIAEEFEAVEAM